MKLTLRRKKSVIAGSDMVLVVRGKKVRSATFLKQRIDRTCKRAKAISEP